MKMHSFHLYGKNRRNSKSRPNKGIKEEAREAARKKGRKKG